jgi:hypothetical protein
MYFRLNHYATSRKVAGMISDDIMEFFIDLDFQAAQCPWGRLSL